MIEHNGQVLTAKTLFQNAFDKKQELEFICYLKGIPFTHKAVIEKLTRHYIIFRTYPTQIVAIKTTGHVFILHPEYKEYTLEAQFLEMKDDDSECVSLYNFKLIDEEFIKRKSIRLFPDNTFSLKLIDPLVRIYEPRVRDISDSSIFLEFSKELPVGISLNSSFHIKMSFRDKHTKKLVSLTVKCSAYRIGEIGGRATLVAIYEPLTFEKQQLLDSYLYSLQLAIINEFKLVTHTELGKEK